MTSDSELNKISTELKHLSLKRKQLLERKKIRCIIQELRNRVEFDQSEEAASYQHEINSIDDKLKQLTERKAELRKQHKNILNENDEKSSQTEVASSQKVLPGDTDYNIFYIEAPPNIPAPTVILDVEMLPPCPCRTQCPECHQFIMTETFTSVSSITWLMCLMTALIGCVAGCCFIPFCLDRFKSTTHKCPKCRTSIITLKKL